MQQYSVDSAHRQDFLLGGGNIFIECAEADVYKTYYTSQREIWRDISQAEGE